MAGPDAHLGLPVKPGPLGSLGGSEVSTSASVVVLDTGQLTLAGSLLLPWVLARMLLSQCVLSQT